MGGKHGVRYAYEGERYRGAPSVALAKKKDALPLPSTSITSNHTVETSGSSGTAIIGRGSAKPCHNRKTAKERSGGQPKLHDEHGMPMSPDHHWNQRQTVGHGMSTPT